LFAATEREESASWHPVHRHRMGQAGGQGS